MNSGRGFDSDWLQKLRDANDLVTIASKYCYIKKQGRKFWACCPFHHERTPSFCINNEEQFFHCFGCGVSGDVIAFIMKIESMDFLDAVKYLADKSGLKLPEFKGEKELFERKQKKDRLLTLLKSANEYYKNELKGKEFKEVLNYISSRGLTQSEIDKFELGYSSSWDGIVKHLSKLGFKTEEMLEVGIVSRDESGRLSDFFAFRLMFPLFNKFGDCIGFSGRDIQNKSKAKYKNSLQSMIFDKSSTVFALNHVKKLKQTQNIEYVIICEGQMDVISMHNAGFNTAVACLGTAITDTHAKEIKRVTDNVVLCLDNDEAGVMATLKAIPILKANNLNVRVAQLQGGKDPDEIIKNNGVDYMSNIINSAKDCVEYQIISLSKINNLSEGSGKSKFLTEVFALLRQIPNKSGREYYIPLISRLTKIPQNVIREDVSDINMAIAQKVADEEKYSKLSYKADALMQSQIFVLASMIDNKDYATLSHDIDLLIKDSDVLKFSEYIREKKQNNETINKVILYDIFGDTNEFIKQCLNYNFDIYTENLKDYFDACVKNIKIKKIDLDIEEMQSKIAHISSTDEKKDIIKKIACLIKEKQKLK